MASDREGDGKKLRRAQNTIGAQSARIKKLEAELAAAKREAAYHFEVVMGQAMLLADAGDILEELGLRNVWLGHLNKVTGGPDYTIGAVDVWDATAKHMRKGDAIMEAKQEALRVTAQQFKEVLDDDPMEADQWDEHDPITAQSGLPVHEPAYPGNAMSGGNAGAAERT